MYIDTYFPISVTAFLSLYNLCHWSLTSISTSLLLCIQQHHVVHSLAEAVLDTTGYKITQETLSMEEEKIARRCEYSYEQQNQLCPFKSQISCLIDCPPPLFVVFQEFKNWPQNQYNSCRSPSKRRKKKHDFSLGKLFTSICWVHL